MRPQTQGEGPQDAQQSLYDISSRSTLQLETTESRCIEQREQGGVACTADSSGAVACATTLRPVSRVAGLASLRMEPLVLRRSHVGVAENSASAQKVQGRCLCAGVLCLHVS